MSEMETLLKRIRTIIDERKVAPMMILVNDENFELLKPCLDEGFKLWEIQVGRASSFSRKDIRVI